MASLFPLGTHFDLLDQEYRHERNKRDPDADGQQGFGQCQLRFGCTSVSAMTTFAALVCLKNVLVEPKMRPHLEP